MCRTQSWFVIPSLVWPTTAEEKEQIVAGEGGRRSCRCKRWSEAAATAICVLLTDAIC